MYITKLAPNPRNSNYNLIYNAKNSTNCELKRKLDWTDNNPQYNKNIPPWIQHKVTIDLPLSAFSTNTTPPSLYKQNLNKIINSRPNYTQQKSSATTSAHFDSQTVPDCARMKFIICSRSLLQETQNKLRWHHQIHSLNTS